MSNKTKNDKTVLDSAIDNAKQAGVVMMAAAATMGLVEVPHHPDKRAIMPHQPVFEFAINNESRDENTMRREREETGPHYISYGISQRTPGRAGRA